MESAEPFHVIRTHKRQIMRQPHYKHHHTAPCA